MYQNDRISLKMNPCVFEQNVLEMDVLCLQSWGTYILAGVGNNLLVYTRNSLKSSTQIFDDERIHGIYVHFADVLVRGGRKVAYVSICQTDDDDDEGVQCVVLWKTAYKDWIQDLVYDVGNNMMGLVTAHNFYELHNLKTGELIESYSCKETSILYSCKVIGCEFEETVIFAGTVFGEVLIWAPSLVKEKLVLQRLIGHDGAVFSIAVDTTMKIITSTSDDRSLRVWSVIADGDLSSPFTWKNSKIELVHSLYGHTARVWKCLIVSDFYVTAGEDSQLNIWRNDGKLVKSLTLHQEGGIRGLHYSTSLGGILTGGEDSGINLISWNFLTDELEPAQPAKTIEVRENFSTRVRFTRNGFVYTIQGGCVFVTGSHEESYLDDNFLSYCVLEVSTNGDHVFLGSLKGFLVILNARTKDVEFEKQIENGRIYSMHYMNEYVLICGPEGRLSLYKHSDERLDLVNVKILPKCSERWSTCAAIHNKNLIVGDRMGNVHIYELSGSENVIRTFRKVHSSQGVTDVIKKDNWVALTIGRDGTVKTLTEDLSHVTSSKLPMDMPWRIVNYNDDVLILGFSGSSLMIWSTKYREVIGSHDCGGGHRSTDFKLIGDKLFFMYVKKKQIFTINFKLNEVLRIRNGHHSKEINCLAILKLNPTTFVTGSEDTILRVGHVEESSVVVTHVLKTHTSSIRTLATFQMSDSERILFVSAGGKGQLVVWTYNIETKVTSEKFSCHLQKERSNWKNFVPTNDPFTRFMCVDVTKFDKQYFIATGCSDCQIRLFRYHQGLTPLCSMSYTHCILKIAILNMTSFLYVASMGTDGRIVFWKVTDGCNASQVGKFSLHQSGINCYDLEEIEKGKKILLYTGGDDNMISASLIEVSDDGVNLKQLWTNTTAHYCQVTGIKVVNDVVLTTSVDQRIRVWKWSLEDDDLSMIFISQYLSQVPDSKGLTATSVDEGIISVIVYGKGLEILTIDLQSERKQKQRTPISL